MLKTSIKQISRHHCRVPLTIFFFIACIGLGLLTVHLNAAATSVYTASSCQKQPELRLGSRGTCVKVLQTALNNWSVREKLTADGIFGQRTLELVKSFQQNNSDLTISGKVGTKTWDYLKNYANGVSIYPLSDITSTPFKATRKVCYRLPAITKDAEGNIYVFAEKRHGDGKLFCSDYGDIEIVMRKLSISGIWSSEIVVADNGKNRLSNPVPIFNSSLNKLFLIYTYKDSSSSANGIYLKTSSDGGRTWKTETVNGNTDGFIMRGVGQSGPGHGMVIATGLHKGRMVVANWHGGMYSDDGGQTWIRGYKVSNVNEGTVAEIKPDILLACHRVNENITSNNEHLCGFSTNGGETISKLNADEYNVPKSTKVQASLLALEGKYKGYVLYSLPSSKTTRKAMSIYAAKVSDTTTSISWQDKQWFKVTNSKTYAAYSDMLQTSDDTVAIVYETGKDDYREKIVFGKYSTDLIIKASGFLGPSSL